MAERKPFGRGFGGRGKKLTEDAPPRQPKVDEQMSSGYGSAPLSTDGQVVKGRGAALAEYYRSKASSSSTSSGFGRGKKPAEKKSGSGSIPDSLTQEMASLSVSPDIEEDNIEYFSGGEGTSISATSNWVRIGLDQEKKVFEYRVDFCPPVDAKQIRFKLIASIATEQLIGQIRSFDGGSILWVPKKLPSTSFPSKHPLTNEDVTIKISLKHETAMWKCLQLYNVLFSKIMKTLKMTLMGKGYFSQDLATFVRQQKLEIWPGYVTAAHQMEGGVMLSVDCSHRVLRDQKVYELMMEIRKNGGGKKEIESAIVGSVVMTRYNKKTYRIDDIDFNVRPTDEFESHNGQKITYIDYYKNNYNLRINDVNQPLLVHKLKKKELKDKDKTVMIYLVPEFCFLTGITDDMRNDFRLMKDIAQHTRLTPNARQAKLKAFLNNVKGNLEALKTLGDWGLVLMDATINLNARVRPRETIFCRQKEFRDVKNADWSREIGNAAVIKPVDLEARTWVLVHTTRMSQVAQLFCKTLNQVGREFGISIQQPDVSVINADSTPAYVKGIQAKYNQQLTKLVVVIFPSPREDRYSEVKKLCIHHLGVSSQCMNLRTISNPQKLRAIVSKIALQINCKLGGELWCLSIPIEGIMICGIDVYHDPVRKGQSVVGFVASLNRNVTRWYSHTVRQEPGQEIVNGMKISFLECLKAFYKENHTLPKTVVIYRDGVSEGMLKLTEDHEVPQISTVLVNYAQGQPDMNFIYIIVLKRISTRIFVSLNAGSYDNPPPGTIVDHTITKRRWRDFFLVSQHVRQGTVSPTHYVVLKDGGSLNVDQIQRLTYQMTHMYYNWPGTIRVPAPCQYAHKVAYLIGQNVRKDPHYSLLDKLYYL